MFDLTKMGPVVRLLSIDPGSTTTGFALWELNVHTSEIRSITTWTFNAGDIQYPGGAMDGYGDLYRRLHALKNETKATLRRYAPLAVMSESPFFALRQPNAFEVLVKVLSTIREAVTEHYVQTSPLFLVDPSKAKRAFDVKGTGKDVVRVALLANKDLCAKLSKPPSMMSEHEVDAVAVGYYMLLAYRSGTLYQQRT